MYRIGKKYKFEIKGRIFYTGIVLEEDNSQIKIKTIKAEELILTKDSIVQAKLDGDNND